MDKAIDEGKLVVELKHKYTMKDYWSIFEETINSLIDICKLYDEGKFIHSRFISVALRTLVHDTSSSTSILTHVNIKKYIKMVDTGIESNKDTTLLISLLGGRYLYDRLAFTMLSSPKSHPIIVPRFMVWYECHNHVNFNKWWGKLVLINNGKSYTRKDIILIAANKFGGAHVDKNVDEQFYKLATNIESLAYISEGRDEKGPTGKIEPLEHTIYAVIRQIAHELLLSLKNEGYFEITYAPDFSKQSLHFSDTRFLLEISNTDKEMNRAILEGRVY